MATSEYIPEKGTSAEDLPSPRALLPEKRSGFFRASMLAPLPMVFNDVIAILVALGAALILRDAFLDKAVRVISMRHSIGNGPLSILYLGWFVAVYVLVARRYGLYGHLLKTASGAHELRMTAQACLNAGLLLCGVLYMTHNLNISRAVVLLLVLSAMVALCIRRAVWRMSRYRQYERGLATRHVVILGTNHVSRTLGNQLRSETRLGYTLTGHILVPGFEHSSSDVPQVQVLGGLDQLGSIVRKYFVDEVVITEHCPIELVIRIIKEARELGIDVRTLSGYYNDLAPHSGIEYIGTFPLVALHRNVPRTIAVALKRAGDFVFALLALIAVSPALLAIAIAIRLESDGPIIYISERIGRRGRIFPCFKFRTMVSNAEQLRKELEGKNERDGVLFKVKNDPRITRLGRFLRKYSLDELPQFFNVLRGEMSLVGPRPPLASEVEKYTLEHLRRLEVPPGLTGLWQVQARQDASFAKYIALDTAYVENWSFWLDMKILFRTAEVVLRGTGT
jgi:exopolysaccharide biosynthesis polyprenyl glycosylphosphotransferase